ncbi:hypothetical protein BC826DRAFT_990066 [Russula brevipes]|nr:hypothetical protein BC826DRAFT_990066 [Russula brevipes]
MKVSLNTINTPLHAVELKVCTRLQCPPSRPHGRPETHHCAHVHHPCLPHSAHQSCRKSSLSRPQAQAASRRTQSTS